MDLSGLKWPAIILVIAVIGWLATSPGVDYMYKKFTTSTPGQDAQQDKIDEAGLTKLGNYLIHIWRWRKAIGVMETCMDRYGRNAPNYWINYYRRAIAYDRIGNYQKAYDIYMDLVNNKAFEKDERIPMEYTLVNRARKLQELHEL